MPETQGPCRYCSTLIQPGLKFCPACGKAGPTGPVRCPKCLSPVNQGDGACGQCGLSLKITCHKCYQPTFFGSYCDFCGERLTVVCTNPKCNYEQPPVRTACKKCGKPLQ